MGGEATAAVEREFAAKVGGIVGGAVGRLAKRVPGGGLTGCCDHADGGGLVWWLGCDGVHPFGGAGRSGVAWKLS